MGILKSLVTLSSTPIRCLDEVGKDLSTLTDDRKDESDGILSIGTLCGSSIVKGVIKSIKKAAEDLNE